MRLEEERSICLRRLVFTSNSSTAPAPASSSTSTTSAVLIDSPRDLDNAGDKNDRPLPEDAREDAVDPAGVGAALGRWARLGVMDDGCTMKPAAEHRHAANTTEAAARGLRFAIVP